MLILRNGSGPDKGADIEAFVKDCTPAQVAWLTQVLVYASEGDYSVFPHIYAACANRWNEMSPDERNGAAHEGEERWFSEEAAERNERELKEAQQAAQKSPIITSNGGGNHV